jgi:hypothetical protein
LLQIGLFLWLWDCLIKPNAAVLDGSHSTLGPYWYPVRGDQDDDTINPASYQQCAKEDWEDQ